MAAKKYFWVQENAVWSQGADKKPIQYGDEIPANVDKAVINSLLKKGKIAEMIPRQAITDEQLKIQRLEAQLAEQTDDNLKEEAELLTKTVQGLQEKLAASEQTVADLTAQLTKGK